MTTAIFIEHLMIQSTIESSLSITGRRGVISSYFKQIKLTCVNEKIVPPALGYIRRSSDNSSSELRKMTQRSSVLLPKNYGQI
jgi:hypothetical protein